MSSIQDQAATFGSRQVGTTWELSVRGELDLVTAPALAEAGGLALSTAPERLLIDLREVEFLDSSALHVLIELRERATAVGVDVVLARPSGAAGRVFVVAGVSDLFADIAAPPVSGASSPRFVSDWSL